MMLKKVTCHFLKIILILFIPFYQANCQESHDTLNLYFNVNQYKLNVYHRVELNALLDRYSEVTYISISGYADTTGSPAYNLELSRKRAVSVKNYLFKIGLDTLIRDFNYYGESRAVMPLNRTAPLFSKGTAILSDRRTETVVGGQPLEMEPVMPLPMKKTGPAPGVPSDNIPPAITPVKMPVNVVDAKLRNDVNLSYIKGQFPDFIEGKIEQGETGLVKLMNDADEIKWANMVTVTDEGQLLSPLQIACFDTLSFTDFTTDTAITLGIPLNFTLDCSPEKIKLYASVNNNGIWKWKEQSHDFSIEADKKGSYALIKVNSFQGCVNFAYPVKEPCFNTAKTILKLKGLRISRMFATLLNINSTYVPAKKDESTYELIEDQRGEHVFLDMVVRDNNHEVYNLRNFPLISCKYIPEKNTWVLTKKDIKRFLRNY